MSLSHQKHVVLAKWCLTASKRQMMPLLTSHLGKSSPLWLLTVLVGIVMILRLAHCAKTHWLLIWLMLPLPLMKVRLLALLKQLLASIFLLSMKLSLAGMLALRT